MVPYDMQLPTIELTGGESVLEYYLLTDMSGNTLTTTGYTVTLYLIDYLNEVLKATKTLAISEDAATGGCVVLALTGSETAALQGKYIYRVKIDDGTGNVSFLQGFIIAFPSYL